MTQEEFSCAVIGCIESKGAGIVEMSNNDEIVGYIKGVLDLTDKLKNYTSNKEKVESGHCVKLYGSYNYKGSINTELIFKQTGEDKIDIHTSYGEKVASVCYFPDLITVIKDLLDDKYA